MFKLNTTLGITGGIGTGKSAVLKALALMDAVVFDADGCVKKLLAGDAAVHGALRKRWGAEVFGEDEKPDHKKIAEIVFRDTRELDFLEELLHPLVRKACVGAMQQRPKNKLFAAEIPLLFEKGFDKEFEHTLCVWTDGDLQLKRLKGRGVGSEEAARRMARQWPLDKKVAAAEFVLVNDGDEEFLKNQLQVLRHRLYSF